MDPILLTRNEAAAALGLSIRTIDYLVTSGKLPSRRLGKRRLIPRAAIQAIAKNGCGRIAPMLKS